MPDIVQSVLASLGTAGILFAITWYWIQKYFDRTLESRFKLLESRLSGAVETSTSLRKIRLEKTAELLSLLQERSSFCRNAFQEFCRTFGAAEFKMFAEQREEYIDCLYGSQLLLPPKTYDCAHRLKRAIDSAYIMVGDCDDILASPVQGAMKQRRQEIDEFYGLLKNALRETLKTTEALEDS